MHKKSLNAQAERSTLVKERLKLNELSIEQLQQALADQREIYKLELEKFKNVYGMMR